MHPEVEKFPLDTTQEASIGGFPKDASSGSTLDFVQWVLLMEGTQWTRFECAQWAYFSSCA
jgi:hypothetical protein